MPAGRRASRSDPSACLVVVVRLATGSLVVVVRVVEYEPTAVAGQDEHVTAVRLGQQPLVQNEVGRALGDEAAVDEGGLVEPLRGADEVVRRRDYGLAAAGLCLEH